MSTTDLTQSPRLPRRVIAAVTATLGTVIWTHALAGVVRSVFEDAQVAASQAAAPLTLAAIVTALAAAALFPRRGLSAIVAAVVGLLASGIVTWLVPGSFVFAWALVPAGAMFAAGGAWICQRLPASFDEAAARRPKLAAVWVLMALVAVVQIGRLSTYMTDPETDWFLSTRHPFYAKHECANAYFYAAELAQRGEANVYDCAHYPGLNPEAEPHTEISGMTPEDPFQYAPQFLLWPRLAIGLTHDYSALRMLWFGINTTLCIGTVILLSVWMGGRIGTVSALLAPAVVASFPVLHNFQYGQFHFAAVALAVLGMLALNRGRPALGGSLLAVSILSKLFPAVLLVPLVAQRRWRDLGWTAGAGAIVTILAFGVLGPAPFAAFFDYHVPRLADGSAFAFDEAWPELATLVIAGNQGIQGMLHKLEAMGFHVGGAAGILVPSYGVALLVLGLWSGLRNAKANRPERAIMWLGLLGMASLASAGAWADYVPLTCVWLLAVLFPMTAGNRVAQGALAVCAVLQVFLLGALPLGGYADGSWMLPLSLISALAMLATFTGAVLHGALTEGRVEAKLRSGWSALAEADSGLRGTTGDEQALERAV